MEKTEKHTISFFLELKVAFGITHKEMNSIFENMFNVRSDQMKTPVKIVDV